MKPLKESIFGDVDTIASNDNALIEQFLKDNYEFSGTYEIGVPYSIDGKNVVNVNGHVRVKNRKIESLTNGLFRFGNVTGKFSCAYCTKLKSLKGTPEVVGGDFSCSGCNELETLEGAPKKIGGRFYCHYCKNLKSLKGGPDWVGWGLFCDNCDKLIITAKDMRKYKITK